MFPYLFLFVYKTSPLPTTLTYYNTTPQTQPIPLPGLEDEEDGRHPSCPG